MIKNKNKKTITCCFCNNSFSCSSNLSRHKKNCGERIILKNNHKNELDEINIKLKHSKELVSFLKKENDYLKLIMDNYGLINKNN